MSPVHVRAEPGDFAESVLLPGDPLRAQYIAETFFEGAELVTEGIERVEKSGLRTRDGHRITWGMTLSR